MYSKCRWVVWLALITLCGCGDDASVYVCVGDVNFCHQALTPIAKAGPNQTVESGTLVTLDGSGSEGSIQTYSWAQTGGPEVTLTNANAAIATFIAPAVTVATTLSFRLTVVNSANSANSSSTNVTVQPPPRPVAMALKLLQGPLQPETAAATSIRSGDSACVSPPSALSPDQSAAQRGLWLAARSIAITKNLDTGDARDFLDAARVMLAMHPRSGDDVAGRLESFGFAMLGVLARERDTALYVAVSERLAATKAPFDAAGLLNGTAWVGHADRVVIETNGDPILMSQRAVELLLQSRTGCVEGINALDVTAASLLVVAEAADANE